MTPTPHMRAASYSRYSSDNQRDTSIADQQRLTGARSLAEGWPLTAKFVDMEISASTPIALRPDGKRLLDAAARGEFEILLIEGLDRCWRDIVDQEQTIRRLEHQGVRIIGVSDGYDTRHDDRELSRGVRGLLNQQYLRDLAKKTHRGLTGQVWRGGYAGGLSFGYRSIDTGAVHQLVIDEDQAKWVRWIFARYVEGWSCQKIASELNRQHIKTGRGGTWGVSTIYGSPNKGSGVLNNDLYVGRYIWNRSQWVKDPDTGKRERQVRPQDEWLIDDRQELRIVDEDQWQKVRARMDGRRKEMGGQGAGRSPKTLLSGLLRCGKCGGAVIAVSAREYGCAARKDRGVTVCSGVSVRRDTTDRRLLTVVREDLQQSSAIVELRQEVEALLASMAKNANGEAAAAKGELSDVEREIERMVNAIVAMGHSDAVASRLKAAEARKHQLLKRQQPTKPAMSFKIDDVMARYNKELMNLEQAIAGEPEQARKAMQEYFGKITIEEDGDGTWAKFSGDTTHRLLKQVGASNYGCGGAISQLEPRRIRLK